MCPGGNQRVTSDQNVCVLGGFMLFVQGALRRRYKNDMSRGGNVNLSRGQIVYESCPRGDITNCPGGAGMKDVSRG